MADGKVERIVTAARDLFLTHGLRGTSMEAIAAAARIAKPTLYAYFADKDAVFEAVVERLAEEWREAFVGGMRGDGDAAARIGAALVTLHKARMRLREGSPHAAELFDGGGIAALEGEFGGAIERELMLAGVVRARLIAQLLMAAVGGVGAKVQSVAELGPAIRLLTERLVRPEVQR